MNNNKPDLDFSDADPAEASRKINEIIWNNRDSEHFKKTRRSFYFGMLAPAAIYCYFAISNPRHPTKLAYMLSAGIGGILHGGVQLSRDIYAVADTDTVLGAKIRLYHQELATHSSLFPYFKNETFRAIHHRDKMNKD